MVPESMINKSSEDFSILCKRFVLHWLAQTGRGPVITFLKKWTRFLLPAQVIIFLKYRLENMKLNYLVVEHNPPVLIYQMGKVGSTSIYTSLTESILSTLVYHVHFISPNMLLEVEKKYGRYNDDTVTAMIQLGKMLYKQINTHETYPWKIITLARDPISFAISQLFQSIQRDHPELINRKNQVEGERVIDYLLNGFNHFDEMDNYVNTWFDKELKEVFNIDIYRYPFNYSKGYITITQRKNSVLLLRYEDLKDNFDSTIPAFLNLDKPIRVIYSNDATRKWYADSYRYVLNNIKIPKKVCERIYSTRYVKYFYSEEMISKFINRWS